MYYLVKPGHYLAGSYKALNHLSIKQNKLKTIQKASTISYESAVRWVHTAAGKTINAITQVEQGDLSAVFGLITRDGYPAKLLPFQDHLPDSVIRKSNDTLPDY